EDEARSRLAALGYRAEDVDMYIDLENSAKAKKAEIKERALTKADILGLLGDGLIDETEAREKLLGLGYLDEDIDLLLGRVKATVPGAIKRASISDFKRAFREGVISEADLREELRARGYEPSDIEMIVKTEIARLPVAPVKLTASKVQEAFRKGVITEAALRTKLSERGYTSEEIDIAVAMNKSMPVTVTKTLTKAETLKAWSKGIIDIEECVDRLLKMGYDQYDIEILLRMSMPEEKLT
ncbi:MAG: hypothetical protein JRE40_15950, partial [Deltaproteobacteria bacterium]|nr:hypothetical protein [Deltaproteobacteria bacterium]